MDDLRVPYYSYETLREKAEAFLARYHPSRSIPTPIEEIVEIDLRMDIVPFPKLLQVFDVDAYLSRDMEAIYVDANVYENFESRYRFSLSHEVAHAVLHTRTFQQVRFSSIREWKSVLDAFPEDDANWFEWHANVFAGLILVPDAPLRERFNAARALASANGLDVNDPSPTGRRMIAGFIANDFLVSSDVIERRLVKCGYWPKPDSEAKANRPLAG